MFEDGPSHQLSWMEEEEGEGEVDGDWEGEGGGGDTSMRPLLQSNSSRAHRTCKKFNCVSRFDFNVSFSSSSSTSERCL